MRFISQIIVAAAVAAFIGTVGCGNSNQVKLYPVKGKFEMTDGDVSVLAGHTIEAALDSDPAVRAAGSIKEDGTFELETLDAGVIRKGAREGTYKARIILDDEDKQKKRLAKKSLNARYFAFESSGLTFQVPAEGAVTLKVSSQ